MRTIERDDHLTDRELADFGKAIRERHHARRLRDRALFAVLASTGKRPGEVIRLHVGDLHLGDHDPWIRFRLLKSRREHGRIQDLPIARTVARTVSAYVRGEGLVPQQAFTYTLVFPMTVRNVELLFKTYARRAGLRDELRLYCLRHTALDRAYRASRDLRLVQDLAGHASPNTTTIYVRADPREVRRVVERIAAG